MTQVTNQLPYEELKPLRQDKEAYPHLEQLMQKVAHAAVVIFFTVNLGMAIALTDWGISLITGAIGGGIIGLITSIAMASLMTFHSKVEQYRLQTLNQIRSITSDPNALYCIEYLKKLFNYPLTGFKEYFQLHLFYNVLGGIGDSIHPQREDAKKVWEKFIHHLDRLPLELPDATKTLFHAKPLLERSSGNILKIETKWINSIAKEEIVKIEEIGKKSFGKEYTFSMSLNGVFVSRNQETKEILGYGWFFKEEENVHIAEIARDPEACRLNIGNEILLSIIRMQKSGQPIFIRLQKNNPFKHKLLQIWGFVLDKELETQVQLKLDWEKFKKILSQCGSSS